jgi:hypothetical protein
MHRLIETLFQRFGHVKNCTTSSSVPTALATVVDTWQNRAANEVMAISCCRVSCIGHQWHWPATTAMTSAAGKIECGLAQYDAQGEEAVTSHNEI